MPGRLRSLSPISLKLAAVVGAALVTSIGVAAPAAANAPWERPVQRFDPESIAGGHASIGTATVSRTWFFAEGYTSPEFEEFVVLNNPGGVGATVQIDILGTGAGRSLTVGPRARATLNVKDVLAAGEGGIAVISDQPIVAERVMYFRFNGIPGGHSTVGATEAGTAWAFGEGYTGHGFATYILLSNPAATPVNATLRFQTETGVIRTATVPIAARGRSTVDAATYVPGTGFATKVHATGPIVAERAMYFRFRDRIAGGHVGLGSRAPATRWDFAEGGTHGQDTFWLIGNPSEVGASVNLSVRTGGGAVAARLLSVPAGGRVTVDARSIVPDGEASATFASTNGIPVVVERSVYNEPAMNFGLSAGGHSTLGAPGPATSWQFGEGYTSPEFRTWVTVANPGDTPARPVVTLRRPDGVAADQPLVLAPRTRGIVLARAVPGFEHAEFAISVASDRPVIAERVTLFTLRMDDPRTPNAPDLGTRVLSSGMSGPDVLAVQEAMIRVGLDPGPLDGYMADNMIQSTYAIEKALGLRREGTVGPEEREFLLAGKGPAPRAGGSHVEIDISRQIALYVLDGETIGWWPTSTGRADDTPRGWYDVYWKDPGWGCGALGCLYNGVYFIGGYAIHGYPSVPTFPASAGCARAPMGMADWIFNSIPLRFPVFIYD